MNSDQIFDEHLGHLEQVFQNLRAANLKIHPGKCRFSVQEIVYLAHRINSFGIKDDSKHQAIETYPVPRNVKNVRAFLGMAQFYRRYIKSFATIALPLNKLLRKDSKFVWTEDCQVAFETLKKALVTAPALAFPQFDKPFILSESDKTATELSRFQGYTRSVKLLEVLSCQP